MAKIKKEQELPLYLFHQGSSSKAHDFMGTHWVDEETVIFRVWAPHAQLVSVVGDFNCWSGKENPLVKLSEQGVWEGIVKGVRPYDSYKFQVVAEDGSILDKCDPYAFHAETRPGNASKLYRLGDYKWKDSSWMKKRDKTRWLSQPVNIYELSLSSWRTYPDGNPFNYRKLAEELIPYIQEMGYTHIELMPVCQSAR